MREPDLAAIHECIHLPAKLRDFVWAEVDLANADPDMDWRIYLLHRAVMIACWWDWHFASEGRQKREALRRAEKVVKSFSRAYAVILQRAGLDPPTDDKPGPDFGRREGPWRYRITGPAPSYGLNWDGIPPGWGSKWRPKPKPRPFA